MTGDAPERPGDAVIGCDGPQATTMLGDVAERRPGTRKCPAGRYAALGEWWLCRSGFVRRCKAV